MSDIWKPQSSEVIASWIKALEDEASDDLSQWELDFVSSIKEQFERRGTLSMKQEKILERIYAEKTS